MAKRILFFQLLLSFIVVQPFASTAKDSDSTRSVFQTIWGDVKSAGNDAAGLWNGLGHLSLGDAALGAGVIAVDVVSFAGDNKLHEIAHKNQNHSTYIFFKDITELGDVYSFVGFPLATYAVGLIAGSESVRTTGRLMMESVILSGTITTTIKIIAGRARPYFESGNGDFRWFEFKDSYNSFPSGHSTVAFAMATVAACRINTWWAYGGFYSVATLVAASRSYLDKHWLSDIFLGSAIGTLSGIAVLNVNEKRESGSSGRLNITPTLNGINLSYILF